MSYGPFIILLAATVLCLAAAGVLAVGIGFFALHEPDAEAGLRVYKIDQVDSKHAGYRRSTMTDGDDVYVNDYEESALQLVNPEPTKVIARKGNFGSTKVCAIPGQPTTAYVAADDGSEMPAYVVYRHDGQPPFDWRSAQFREMTFISPSATNSGLKSTDSSGAPGRECDSAMRRAAFNRSQNKTRTSCRPSKAGPRRTPA